MKNTVIAGLVAFSAMSSVSVSASEWKYGVGTGLGALDISGDGGFNTQLRGPLVFDASLDPSDVMDYVSSSFSLAGFATNGKYTIGYKYGMLELEETLAGSFTQSNVLAEAKIGITAKTLDVNVAYRIGGVSKNSWHPFVGISNYSQEYEAQISVDNAEFINGTVDDNWTDFYVGIKNQHAFSPTFSWSNSLRIGGGDSDGYYGFNSTLTKIWNTSWATSFSLNSVTYDYENGNPGDEDFYLYDATETTLGFGITYLF